MSSLVGKSETLSVYDDMRLEIGRISESTLGTSKKSRKKERAFCLECTMLYNKKISELVTSI